MNLIYQNNNFINIPQSVQEFLNIWNNSNKFINLKTSGSTGIPKIIKAKKEYLKKSALYTGKFLNLQNNSALCCLPIEYISGKMMLIRTLELNLTLYFIEPCLEPLKNLNFEIDFCAMTPMQVENSLDKLHLIRKLIIGGSSISEQLRKKIQSFNTEIYETFGMTETFSHFALKKISQNNSNNFFETFTEFSISKDKNNCLIVKTPYFKNKLKTNDIVDIQGNNFLWKGRADFIINSGGIKLNPEMIEKKIEHLINKPFIISSVFDEILENKLILIIEENKQKINLKELKNKLQYTLTKYEIPKEIHFIKKFERTKTNKIKRN